MREQARARLLLVLRIGVTAAAAAFVFKQIDVADLRHALAATETFDVLLGIGCLFAAVAASALRWHWILTQFGSSGKAIPMFRLYTISLFFNQLLPTSIGGDTYRAIAAKSLGVGLAPAIESVVIDRSFALLTLVALVAMLTPFARLAEGAVSTSNWIVYALATAVGLGTLVAVFGGRMWERFPGALRRSIVRLRGLARNSTLLSGIVLLSVISHALVGLSLWWMTPLPASSQNFADVLFLSGAIVLVTALPISVGGWGVREGGVVAGLMLLGTSNDAAISAALFWGLAHICIAVPGALWSIGAKRGNPSG